MNNSRSRFFKIYVCVSLLIIILLLGALVGAIIYGGNKVKSESVVVNNKVNSFNQSVNIINKNLQNLNAQLQKQNTEIANQKIPSL